MGPRDECYYRKEDDRKTVVHDLLVRALLEVKTD